MSNQVEIIYSSSRNSKETGEIFRISPRKSARGIRPLKRGDRLSKKERQTTASDSEKATNCDLCYGSKVTATFVTIKQVTKQLQNE